MPGHGSLPEVTSDVPSWPPPGRSSPPAPPRGVQSASRWSVGARLADRYRLVHTLGRGGSAEVWCALCEVTGTHVAMKLHDEADDDEEGGADRALERFHLEARLAGLVANDSPHVVRVLDVGLERGVPFLVMERVNGRSLAQELDRCGVVPTERFAGLFAQVAEAVAALHDAGFVHGDLKPGNLLVHGGPAGALVKVADFGAALPIGRPAPDPDDRSTPAFVLGSPAYMSPEQLAGDALDERSDVWSLGVVAYEAVTGWPPFGAASVADLVTAIATRPHPPPSRRRASVPPGFDAWIERALDKAPAGRFASVRSMAEALGAALAASDLTPAT